MGQEIELQKDGYYVTSDRNKLDIQAVYQLLKQTYWAENRSSEIVLKSLENSLCFSLFEGNKQIGLLRIVTDYATFAYLCDVIIDEAYRHKGLGEWFLKCVFQHPKLQNLRRWCLATKDAHTFYEKFGFRPLSQPENFMEIFNG
ncbi:GNAT family N-acetyltransferase [Anaerocolumna sp. AGMB13020]|uniref:GNAT family N-acetyltransferase n=1 Tax=Anaerocolumna sp. AGMB13020 TaxID=3081750 RepID=UPI002953EFF0|nr:GNAT family N-acetyltransferase [Anaerocolumna sp. AGMB13020]WOO35953.1 GNAT family N-acetyltransferase [Anaerocolumna sp. AGMB13020]